MAVFTESGKVYHVDVKPGDIGRYVFLPGDPFRTDLIASFLDDAVLVAHHREHKTWTGYLNNEKDPGVHPDACVNCGYCERKCPQHLKVRELLKKVAGTLSSL